MAGPNGRRSLAARLKDKRIVVAPGVYDAVTARIAVLAERQGQRVTLRARDP